MKLYVKLFNGTFNKYLIIFYHFASQLQIPHLGYPWYKRIFLACGGKLWPEASHYRRTPPPPLIILVFTLKGHPLSHR